MTGGSSHHQTDGRRPVSVVEARGPAMASRSRSTSVSSVEPWYSGPATSSQAPRNTAQAIVSSMVLACQRTGPAPLAGRDPVAAAGGGGEGVLVAVADGGGGRGPGPGGGGRAVL